MVQRIMKNKMKDNSNFALKSRKKRDKRRLCLESMLWKNSKEYREIVKNVKKNGDKLRRNLRKKYIKKTKFLTEKYGMRKLTGMDGMTDEEKLKYGNARIFWDKCELIAEEVKGPVLVCREREQIQLNEDERLLLSLGPKFSIVKKLSLEEAQKFRRILNEVQMGQYGGQPRTKN